jgi:hypothetical protein
MPVPVVRQARRSVDPIQTVDQPPLAPNRGNRGLRPDAAGSPSKDLVIKQARAFHHRQKKEDSQARDFCVNR